MSGLSTKGKGRPATGFQPKKHLTVVGTPEEVDFIKKTIKERGYKTKSRLIINLILDYLKNEEKTI